MQNSVLEKVGKVAETSNLVYLVSINNPEVATLLTLQELNYVKTEFAKKNYQVFLNRYSQWIYIVTFDSAKKKNESAEALRKTGNTICQYIQKSKTDTVTLIDSLNDSQFTIALTEGILLGNYQFLNYFKDADEKRSTLKKVSVFSECIKEADIEALSNLMGAVYNARNLVNEPASVLTSVELAQAFQKMGKEAGCNVEVLDKAKIEALKMGGILAVNQGSTQAPTFSVITWKPANAVNANPIIMVGKGVVYDTGGYSLKPTADSMDYMKCDMAGAATVSSVVCAAAKNKLPVYVIALVPSTDNRIGPDAYSPGDVITISDGTTVEVMNTDAEGRLILADALVFAQKYNPELVIDVATLTGAAHRAIGTIGMVGMGNASDEVFDQLTSVGQDIYERIAVFPFWDEYKEQLKSEIADLKNIGGELAGAITAGKFLEHFTNYPYIHLDIAGVAFLKKADSYRTSGEQAPEFDYYIDF